MVLFIVALDAADDRRRVLDGRLRHRDGLEAAFERRVFFDVLAVFGERRRADHLDLAAGKRRLQDVRGVHTALRVAGADKVVHLVDEQDDVAVLLHLVDKALDAAFKLAAELRARDKRRQVQKLHFLLAQLRRHLAGRDAQRKALGDRRLADARLADQARVVLRAAREDLHHALDLALAPDDIVELAAARLHRQVGAVRRDVLALRLVEVLLLGAAVFSLPVRRAALLHRAVAVGVHAELAEQLGGERHRAARLEAAVLRVHQAGHALGHRLELLLRDAHLFHDIVDRLDPELFRADEAVALRRAHVGGRRYKNDCRSLLASSTHHHILKYPF